MRPAFIQKTPPTAHVTESTEDNHAFRESPLAAPVVTGVPGNIGAGNHIVALEFVADATINFALQQNRVPVIKRLRIHSTSDQPLGSVEIRIVPSLAFGETLVLDGGYLRPGEERIWSDLKFELNVAFLTALRESLVGHFEIEVFSSERRIHSERREVELLAADCWNGLRSLPELLAAFVLPNTRAVESILADAAERLLPGNLRLDGYQSKNRQAAVAQVESIFAAIQARGIHYSNPPASFEQSGQKVRLPQRILESGLATCLDTTLLFCACAEQAGLHPLVVMIEGHAFCGIWLEENTFPESAQDSHSRLKNRVDLDAILPVETTLLCDAKAPFAAAVEAGRRHLADESGFQCVIDIVRCRQLGVRPLPLLDDGGVDEEAVKHRRERAEAGQQSGPAIEVDAGLDLSDLHTHVAGEQGAERLNRWKRNLLDLSLNNRLLHFRSSQKTLSLLPPGIAVLEDALALGNTFTLAPSEFRPPEGRSLFEVSSLETGGTRLLEEGFARATLYAPLDETTLYRRLTEIYRAARLSLEENGSNTLYLALGFLRWRRSDDSDRVHEAPLLLVPLTLERQSVKDGYRLRRGDEETAINTSLLELLKVEFGLVIPGLDPLPEDESGADVSRILKLVRHAIADYRGWTVVEAAEVGLFSFAKFLMWKDLESHAEDLRASPLVSHLMRNDGTAPDFADSSAMDRPEELDTKRHPSETYAPLSADSTQLAAVFSGAGGHTFVLEGPPGTGKSQTIANLIVHALGKGRSVLFVAEKRAALEVVHRRLSQIGLGDFILELHSNKASKVDVLKQLADALNAKDDLDTAAWANLADTLAQRRDELNEYVAALHRRRPSGLSVWNGLNRLIELGAAPVTPLELKDPLRIGEDQLCQWRKALEALRSAWQMVGDPATHPLVDCRFDTVTRAREREGGAALGQLGESLSDLEAALIPASQGFDLPSGAMDASRVRYFLGVLEWLAEAARSVPETLLIDDAPSRARIIAEAAEERDAAESDCTKHWYEATDAGSHPEWARRMREVEAANPVARFFERRKLLKELRGRLTAGKNLTWQGIAEAVAAARRVADATASFESVKSEGERLFGEVWQGGTHASSLRELANLALSGGRRIDAFAGDSESATNAQRARKLAAMDPQSSERRTLAESGVALGGALQRVEEAHEIVVDTLGMTCLYWSEGGGFKLADLQARVREMSGKIPEMREWRLWLDARSVIEQDPVLAAWLPGALAAGLPSETIVEAFEKAFLILWTDAEIDAEPCLSGFFRQRHEGRIEEFRRLDEEYRALAMQVVRARLAAKIPEAHAPATTLGTDSEMGVLIRELQKRQRHLPVRKLLEQIPRLLRLLKPCLLMSPLSVAQYLRASKDPYDIVVFDEASQITPWDALGALARGRSAVIVGDPKQLPPTSFFQRGSDSEEPDESLDLESILDECLAARLPCKRLGWHYRSRHESLITFSNHRYYGNSLLTFPSTSQRMAVKHLHVADGHYDTGKSRTNKKEAERVVAEVVERLTDPERRSQSLGVVTFSITQQRLIEELLDKERAAKPELEPWFSDSVDEPVFVKNLESVQGDERDIIIFALGYGPDLQGRVSMNFGPLNRDGGQRRLNVAITRAREEVLVVSTLLPEHIDLTRTAAPGVGDLRSFLEYARRGPAALANLDRRLGTADHDSPFEAEVAAALSAHGYETHAQVGCSGYRIDLAVVHPDLPGAYLLGVECDGATYHSSRNARDRDKLRQAVLEGLGWTIARLWSTEWWRDPQREIARIVEGIEEARRNFIGERRPPATNVLPAIADEAPGSGAAPKALDGEKKNLPWELPTSAEKPDLPVYQAHRFTWPERPPELFHEDSETPAIRFAIDEVLAAEAPLSESLLTARVRAQWGLKASGKRIFERVRSIAAATGALTVTRGETIFYWPSGAEPERWSHFRVAGEDPLDQRSVEDLPLEEIAAAAHAVLSTQLSLTKDGLVAETARLLGYKRTGRKVTECIGAGVDLLVSRGIAEKE